MRKYQLLSGKIIEFSLAPITTGLALYRAVTSECRNTGLNLKMTEDMSTTDLLLNNTETILKILGSEQVMDAAIACCDKVLYNKQRFSLDLFEQENARCDFFGTIVVVALENLVPFFPQARTVSEIILSRFLR